MSKTPSFDIQHFIPYLLAQAADVTSQEFATHYKSKYGMLRTEWRVLFHLGRYGKLTAKDICQRAHLHKTKVSRAVRALEQKRYLRREVRSEDRRKESLELTPAGERVFDDLAGAAQAFDAKLMAAFSQSEAAKIRAVLARFAQI